MIGTNLLAPAGSKFGAGADQVGAGVDHAAIASGFSETAVLRAVTPTITTLWLIDAIESAVSPPIPEVRNAEGDELLFCTAHYPLTVGTTGEDIRSALARRLEFRQENATFWNWIKLGKPGVASGKKRLPPQSQMFITTLGDGSLVLGNVELTEKTLVLSVNSRARCERGRALLSATLGGLVGQPLVEMQSIEQLKAARGSTAPPMPDISEQERLAILRDSMDRHYCNLLDQPIPALDNKSPRAAAKTARGRVKIVDWLKMIENSTAASAVCNNEMANYSFDWLWAELGVAELRR